MENVKWTDARGVKYDITEMSEEHLINAALMCATKAHILRETRLGKTLKAVEKTPTHCGFTYEQWEEILTKELIRRELEKAKQEAERIQKESFKLLPKTIKKQIKANELSAQRAVLDEKISALISLLP